MTPLETALIVVVVVFWGFAVLIWINAHASVWAERQMRREDQEKSRKEDHDEWNGVQ